MFSSKDVSWKGGPGHYGKSVISPQSVNITQSIESHIEAYAPGASGQKHGHLNSAVFYVLKGHGHDVHDGRHIPWKAGDVMLVENACVHQHFNDLPGRGSDQLLVFKAKPLFLFMHLLFQKNRGMAVEDPAQGGGKLQAAGGHLGRPIMATVFTDKGPAFSGTKTATFRADEVKQSLEFRKQLVGDPDQRGAGRGHALGAFRRRADQASGTREAEHARNVRRSLHAVPQASARSQASTAICGKS